MTEYINGFRGEYFFLSNFAPSTTTITYREKDFILSTGEHVFHAMKVAASNYSEDRALKYLQDMQDAETPNKAKLLGRQIQIDAQRWDAMSYACMERTTKLKYDQNPDLAEKLIATDPALLIEENTWGDRLWGTVNGVGLNQLGKILVNHRDTLIKEKNND